MEVVASFSQGRTAAAQCGLFTHKSVPFIFEPPCIWNENDFWFFVWCNDSLPCLSDPDIACYEVEVHCCCCSEPSQQKRDIACPKET